MEKNVKIVPVKCTQCGGMVEVNTAEETGKCPFCGTAYVIENAAGDYNVKFDVNGAVKDVLGFVGEQMRENREDRRERRKEEAEERNKINSAFFKLFGIMFAGMCVLGLIMFLVANFTGGFDEDTSTTAGSEDSKIEAYVDGGSLYTDILGSNVGIWKYCEFESTGTVLEYESNETDGYHSCVRPEQNALDVGYVITAAYAYDANPEDDDPLYYSISRVTIENDVIVDASEPVIVDSLDDYSFGN